MHKSKTNEKIFMVAMVVLAAVALGCQRGGPEVTPDYDTSDVSDVDPSGVDDATTGDGLPDVDVTELLFERDSGLQTIYFDFDDERIRGDMESVLRNNAELIQEHPGVMIQVEGHTCEIGTQEYNLALGERRALSVRNHLMRLGVSGDRLITVSYGEEMPANTGTTESAYRQNRRVEFSRAM